ncbi:MAG: hypothetical protein H7832_12755 [Magnetococcus sp. DMHC-6]
MIRDIKLDSPLWIVLLGLASFLLLVLHLFFWGLGLSGPPSFGEKRTPPVAYSSTSTSPENSIILLGQIKPFALAPPPLSAPPMELPRSFTESPPIPMQNRLIGHPNVDFLNHLRQALENIGIVTWTDPQTGAVYLPEFMEFQNRSFDFFPKQRAGLEKFSAILAQQLSCFINTDDQASLKNGPGCEWLAGSKDQLAAIVLEGHSVEAVVGTPRFRANWSLAQKRAYGLWMILLRHQPRLAALRGLDGDSLFRLGSYAGLSTNKLPPRRVQLRFIFDEVPAS